MRSPVGTRTFTGVFNGQVKLGWSAVGAGSSAGNAWVTATDFDAP